MTPQDDAPRVEARFVVEGPAVDPRLVTSRLGIQPTAVALAGERIPGTTAVRQIARWELASGIGPERELEEHVAAIIEQLGSIREVINELPDQWDRVISAVIHLDASHMPPIHFEAPLLAEVAAIGCTIDVDLYPRPDPEDLDRDE